MTSIYGVLYQGLLISLTAVVIIILRKIFEDKLSPEWHYYVWSVMALRILIPASVMGYVFFPMIPYIGEFIKTIIEENLVSAYADAWHPIINHLPVPYVTALPKSITDWLMIVYIIGVIVSAVILIRKYRQFHQIFAKCEDPEVLITVNQVAEKYGFKPVSSVVRSPLKGACVCGLLHKTLVLPAEGVPDEKILLHELIHIQHHDSYHNAVSSQYTAIPPSLL